MALARAGRIEHGLMARICEKALEVRRELDDQFAVMISNHLVEAWNKGQKRGR